LDFKLRGRPRQIWEERVSKDVKQKEKHGIKLWKERQIGQRNWLLCDSHKSTDIKGGKDRT
jgi:hypothetical protein